MMANAENGVMFAKGSIIVFSRRTRSLTNIQWRRVLIIVVVAMSRDAIDTQTLSSSSNERVGGATPHHSKWRATKDLLPHFFALDAAMFHLVLCNN